MICNHNHPYKEQNNIPGGSFSWWQFAKKKRVASRAYTHSVLWAIEKINYIIEEV